MPCLKKQVCSIHGIPVDVGQGYPATAVGGWGRTTHQLIRVPRTLPLSLLHSYGLDLDAECARLYAQASVDLG
jgi:hypothetical protein